MLGLLLALSVFSAVRAAISDLRLCGDPDCREPVSKGVTVISYPSNDKDVLSFHNNVPVIVFSKEAGTRKDLWGVEIHGKRGYAPWKYIREHKVFKSKLNYTVPTERSLGKEKVEHDKPKLSEDLGSQGTKAEEEQASEETTESLDVAKTETDSDFTKSLKVARAAEDVKHNSLPPALPPGEQEEVTTHTIPEGSSVATKEDAGQPTDSEGSTTEGDGHITEEEKELEEEEEGQKDEEEQIKEEEDGSHEELDDHSGVEDKESENETVGKGDDGHVEVAEASTIASPSGDDKKKEEAVNREKIISEGDLLVEPSEPPLEPESKPPLPLNLQGPSQKVEVTPKEPEDSSIVTLEPSPVSFEVIDGTTVYLDEDTSTTATTTPTNAQTSEAPIASPVMGEAPPAAATLPIPALLHHLPPASPSNSMVVEKLPNVESPKLTTESESRPSTDSVPLPNLEGQETVEIPASTTESEAAAAAEAELYFNELEVISTAEETEPQPDDSAGKSSKEIEEDFNPLGTGAEVEEAVPTTEVPENDFGAPKQDSIIESNDVTTEEPVESQGFFSSWFGSSETADSLEAEESPETSEPSESEAPLDDTLDVDATLSEDNKDIKDEHNEETTTVHDTPPDAISVPANESEGVSTDAQYPNATDNIDEVTPNSTKDVEKNALKSSEPSVPFVESRSSASPDKEEQSPEVLPPSTDDASSADFVHDTNEAAEGSEEDAGGHLGGGEAEPGPSTARPMYAEPEPTTQSYADASVDTDELAQLAGTKEPADGDAQESSAEGSLIQKFLKASHNMLPEGLAFGVEAEIAEPEVSKGALAFLAIVVFTIITIYVVHLIMMKLSRESPILAALNNMDREKRILLHENATLHEELCKARAELEVMALHITESNGDTTELDAQLELIKREHAAEAAHQEEKIAQLEHELEEATSNSMEMHKMLSEMLSAQKDTTTFQASVDHLQEMLDGQQEKVEALNSDLALKSRLNEELHLELSASREQVSKLDTQVQQLTQSLKEISNSKEETSQQLLKEIELVKELQTVNESISKQSKTSDEQLSALEQELQALQDTIATLRESVETKDSELKVAKECLKQIQLTSEDSKVVPDDKKLSSLFDVIKIKAELQRVSSERLNLEDQLKDSEMAQKNLEDAMSSIRSEVTELRSMHDEAVHEKQEAMSKLAVLTQYFEEKEAQLTKELESQEGMRMNAEGSAASVAQKIHNYELEVTSYKTRVESLQKELQAQEESYKTQIASYEQKAHDNWLQARTAERRNEEQRQENSQLRNRLTLLQKEKEGIQGGILKPTPKRLDANGRIPSPGALIEGEVDGDHSETPPHPMHGPPPMLPPMMLPPGAPLPPGIPPPHGFPGVPPPPPPPGMSRGMPPPFLHGELPFMRPPYHPLPGDRRLPPAGGMPSPPYRRSGSPTYNHRNDRYSPSSEHSHLSDRHYSPPPLRHRPPSPDMHRRNHSPDRRSDRLRSPDRRSDRVRASPDHHRSNRRTPDRRLDRRSPDRRFTRSPDGYHRHRASPHDYYDHSDYNSDDSRLHQISSKGKKTSTPLVPSDRWKNDV